MNKQTEIMNEQSQRTMGKDAQRTNILAAKLTAEAVRSTLGPKGMDKMLINSLGDIIVTNDGVTILKEMQIEHPAAKMIVEVAKTQENEVGDGTTTAVVFTGELLKNAEDLLDKKIHPSVIIKGYQFAMNESLRVLNEIADNVTIDDTELLRNIAKTAMTGKKAEVSKDILSDLCVRAIQQVYQSDIESVSLEDIKLEKRTGAGIEESQLIKGIVIDKEKTTSSMPDELRNVKIVLLDCEIGLRDMETTTNIQITDPNRLRDFMGMEETMLIEVANKVIDSGANVVICQKGIEDFIQFYLAKAGIYAVRRVKRGDMEKIAKAVGGNIISNLNELTETDLGYAEKVSQKKIGEENMTFIEGCHNPRAVTILVRGGTEHIVDEIQRAIEDALGDLVSAVKSGKIVYGAGATEIEVANKIREYASEYSGREHLAITAFADAMEVIPKTLAENSGFDPIDALTELKSAHKMGNKWFGFDVFTGEVVDSKSQGIIEPLKVKTLAISSATEVAEMILRIDDILLAKVTRDRMKELQSPGDPGLPFA